MDSSSLEALVSDPSRCSKLSMDQRRELVYEISKWSDSATEMLQAWSRHDILQILCAELGKERKYTGLTKAKIIEHLLKIVDEKKSQGAGTADVSKENDERTPKRQRKYDHPSRLVVASSVEPDADSGRATMYCKNSACKAKLNREGDFCKRCSCCICRQYDDNKDPGLWLICNSDPPFHGVSCGMSCHLECALRHENSGISQDRQDKGLDGSFCCVSCGKVNDLLGSWRKQLVVARDTRRVDILCYRLSLAQKILAGTKHYQNLYGIIDEAVIKVEEDVGPLTGLPVKMARGIVNRLSSGQEIQRLCASAVESLDLMLSNRVSDIPSDCNTYASKLVTFEDIRDSSLALIVNSDDSNVENVAGGSQNEGPNPNSKILGLERSQSPVTNCSTLSNPSSVEDETNNVVPCRNDDEIRGDNYLRFCENADKVDTRNDTINCSGQSEKETDVDVISLNHRNKESSNNHLIEETSKDNGSNTPIRSGLECVLYVNSPEARLPITPCKFEKGKDIENGPKCGLEPRPGSSSKKRSGEGRDEGFEYYVKIIRWLECDGHIETAFRQKFLTWYGLIASPEEVRVVKVFVDTFIEDPESLAGQLVDTFSDVISDKRCSAVPAGFCTKLWH
ncbi:hypothetical protein BUALT_Bualt16G0102400 [Buddleja alternifolia]|uniref:Oberon PHD finger domain-containing protein n=1 Tax=Buddleja alternifolia TaxID=168488 RepID=A0AAV6W8G0_9LAMI|nr:hypothetical protein BUALT_Bualt16G0102400 [Buddleja alternifolia]